jgi:hypothetical protein
MVHLVGHVVLMYCDAQSTMHYVSWAVYNGTHLLDKITCFLSGVNQMTGSWIVM